MRSFVLFMFSIVLLLVYSQMCAACPRCTTPEECAAPPPTPCPYGEYVNYCKRRACLKGPGEKCGGPPKNSFGKCSQGLYCQNERCRGCHLYTMECSQAPFEQ